MFFLDQFDEGFSFIFDLQKKTPLEYVPAS